MKSVATLDIHKHLYVTILAGGVGSRFWPASTRAKPKQLLPLATSQPMVVDTVDRALKLVPPDRIRILAGAHLHESLQNLLPDLPSESFKIEPQVRGTAAALTWASWEICHLDPEAVMISLHADHLIQPEEKFLSLVGDIVTLLETNDWLFTIAINPEREETGYGYIEPGDSLAIQGETEAFKVTSFKEKPGVETVKEYLKKGYLWNSGIFVWKAKSFIDEINSITPEISKLLFYLSENRPIDFFEHIPVMTVDEGVLERSSRIATVLASFQWDDIGTWSSLSRVRQQDENGNVLIGNGELLDTKNSVIYSENVTFITYGIEDLVLIQAGDVVLATRKKLAADLKTLLSSLSDLDAEEDS